MELLSNISTEVKVIIFGFVLILILISVVIIFMKNTKIKNSFTNQGIIFGDVDNSTKVINETIINTYVSTGKKNNKEPEGKVAKLANGILNIPESFMNWVSSDLLSGNDFGSIIGGIIVFLFVMLCVFSAGFLLIKPISLIALSVSGISIIYYLYLSLVKKEFINWNLIIIQTIYVLKMSLILLPITRQSSTIIKHSLSQESFIFWKNQILTLFAGMKENTLTVSIFSLVLYAFICLIFSYFQLYSSLNLTAQRKNITWKSSFFALIGLILFGILLINIEAISNLAVILINKV